MLLQSPLGFFVWIGAILIALTIHEFSHALAAYSLGDRTAKDVGRLTLNPLAHIDWIGLLALIFIGIGWGKPVPFNPYNLRNQKWGPSIVAFAGPVSNLVMASLCFGILKFLKIFTALSAANLLVQFLFVLLLIDVVLMLFNLIPIPPLDGSKFLFAILAAPKYSNARHFLETKGTLILLLIILADSFLGIHILSSFFSWVIIEISSLI
jgi:Zn-dependent protease